MKKTSILFFVSALIVLFTLNPGCRKPKDPVKPKDPCANTVLVEAIDHTYNCPAQFLMTDPSGMPYLLYAINWSDYSAKVSPGKKYNIAYQEVSCNDCDYYKGNRDFMECGCFGPQVKCVKITCLKEVPNCTLPASCLFSEVNPLSFPDKYTHALEGIKIVGNEFKVKVGYSGCDRSEIKNFRLALQETRFRCPEPKLDRVFMARVVTDNHLLCQAYFEEEACFDLSNLRAHMISENYDMSKPVVIRLQYRDGTDHDFTYQP